MKNWLEIQSNVIDSMVLLFKNVHEFRFRKKSWEPRSNHWKIGFSLNWTINELCRIIDDTWILSISIFNFFNLSFAMNFFSICHLPWRNRSTPFNSIWEPPIRSETHNNHNKTSDRLLKQCIFIDRRNVTDFNWNRTCWNKRWVINRSQTLSSELTWIWQCTSEVYVHSTYTECVNISIELHRAELNWFIYDDAWWYSRHSICLQLLIKLWR